MNEQPKNQQPAAAPIDECELCHSSGYMDETLGGALPGVPDAPCMNGCKATEQTAPSPADERAALAKLRAEMFDWLASCTKEHIDGKIEFINRVTEGFAAIYARAAASPAAEVAQWQFRLKDRSSPVVDHWVNISPDGAKTLMEKYADVYEVRALYTAPRSPAVAAEAVAWRSWKDGDGYGFWDTRDEAELASAHDFEPEPLYTAPPAAGEAAQPSLKNPLTPYGMLVRALRIVAETALGEMAKHLGCSPATLSAVEFGRKPLTAAMVADTAAYFSSVGIPDTLHALSAAWRAHALVDGADHAA
ncbi:hypothetical protein QZM91_24115 [Burkholderia multivorans]|nr:hypothetical protein [Burkholderia multivorans]